MNNGKNERSNKAVRRCITVSLPRMYKAHSSINSIRIRPSRRISGQLAAQIQEDMSHRAEETTWSYRLQKQSLILPEEIVAVTDIR